MSSKPHALMSSCVCACIRAGVCVCVWLCVRAGVSVCVWVCMRVYIHYNGSHSELWEEVDVGASFLAKNRPQRFHDDVAQTRGWPEFEIRSCSGTQIDGQPPHNKAGQVKPHPRCPAGQSEWARWDIQGLLLASSRPFRAAAPGAQTMRRSSGSLSWFTSMIFSSRWA